MKQGQMYTLDEVVEMPGAGSDDYILAKNGKVQAITLNPETNPKAPEVVIVGQVTQCTKTGALLKPLTHSF